MHVMIANNVYPPIAAGGAELIVSYLAEELVRRGHRATVLSTCPARMEPYPDEIRNGVAVIRFFPRNRYWQFERNKLELSRLDKLRWHLTDAWNRDAFRRTMEIVADQKPDVLHTHLIDGFSASIWAVARRAGIPVVHTAHDYHMICPRAFMLTRDWKLCTKPSLGCKLYRRWHVATAGNVDLFCSPSAFLIDEHGKAGMNGVRTLVVRNGIPLPTVPTQKARGDGQPLRLLMPVRLTQEKGIRVVLEAMKLLPPDLPVVLDIAGRGDLEGEVQTAADRDPRITYHGYVQAEAKQSLFSEADIFLLPSLWYENAPVVIVEAAAYGLGILASRLGAIPEFVRHEKTGLLFDPGSATDLARSIRRLLDQPDLLATFRTESASFAADYTLERMADAYEKAYQSVSHTNSRNI